MTTPSIAAILEAAAAAVHSPIILPRLPRGTNELWTSLERPDELIVVIDEEGGELLRLPVELLTPDMNLDWLQRLLKRLYTGIETLTQNGEPLFELSDDITTTPLPLSMIGAGVIITTTSSTIGIQDHPAIEKEAGDHPRSGQKTFASKLTSGEQSHCAANRDSSVTGLHISIPLPLSMIGAGTILAATWCIPRLRHHPLITDEEGSHPRSSQRTFAAACRNREQDRCAGNRLSSVTGLHAAHIVPQACPALYDAILGSGGRERRFEVSSGLLLEQTSHGNWDDFLLAARPPWRARDRRGYRLHYFGSIGSSSIHGRAMVRGQFVNQQRTGLCPDAELPNPLLADWHYLECVRRHLVPQERLQQQ